MKNKNFVVALFLIIIGIILGSIMTVSLVSKTTPVDVTDNTNIAYKNKNNETEQKQPNAIKDDDIKQPDTVITKDTIDTSDWRTYINEEFGFELKHPRDWSLSFITPETGLVNQATKDGQSSSPFRVASLRFFFNNIVEGKMTTTKINFLDVLDIYFEDQNTRLSARSLPPNKKYIEINGIRGIAVENFENPSGRMYNRYFLDGNNSITFELYGLSQAEYLEYADQIEAIKSSFKLIDVQS